MNIEQVSTSDRNLAYEKDEITDYMNLIGRFTLLKADQEVELAMDMEAGTYARHLLEQDEITDEYSERELRVMARAGERAETDFYNSNLKLVVSIANHYKGRGVPLMDIIQLGNIGLIKAVRGFDYTKGFKFSTYATRMISGEINKHIYEISGLIKLPKQKYELSRDVNRIKMSFLDNTGRFPTDEEIAAELAKPTDDMEKLVKKITDSHEYSGYRHVSLSMSVGENSDTTIENAIEDIDAELPGDALEWREDMENIAFMFENRLSKIERFVIDRYFGMSGEDPVRKMAIAKELNEQFGDRVYKTATVTEIERRALEKLRNDAYWESDDEYQGAKVG